MSAGGSNDIFLAKLTDAGSYVYAKHFGDTETDQGARSVAVRPNGEVAITGSFLGTIDLGDGPFSNPAAQGSIDIFMAWFDPSGNHLWSQQIGDPDYQGGQDVAFDSSGYLIATGFFGGTVNFGLGPLSAGLGFDMFVTKWAP